MSQSTQCLGSVVPLAMIVSNSFICFNISISLIKEQLFFTGSSNKGVLFVSSVCVSGHSVAGVTLPGPLSLLSAQSTIIHNNYQPSFYQQCQQKSTIKSNTQLSLCLQYHQAHQPCLCHTGDDDEPTIKTSWFDLELPTYVQS